VAAHTHTCVCVCVCVCVSVTLSACVADHMALRAVNGPSGASEGTEMGATGGSQPKTVVLDLQ
jgi:hypothetical protein